MTTRLPEKQRRRSLLATITCPHCWHKFQPDQTLWIASHPDLRGDDRLGDEYRRFLPTRFDPDGLAYDARGQVCHDNACPKCHLSITRASLELAPSFVSIVGSPGSGKSYLLASMLWSLRKTLPKYFHLDFSDADSRCNRIVNKYEEDLFMQDHEDHWVQLRKTQMEGDLYDVVMFPKGRKVNYSKPFLFSVKPMDDHPQYESVQNDSRLLVLYDNAGEHFSPDANLPDQPGTEHLAHAKVLLFLFDPTQHPQFRKVCRSFSVDPQLRESGRVNAQHVALNETASRIRQWTGISHSQRDKRLLIVIVTKHDVWGPLFESRIPYPLTSKIALYRYPDGSVHLNLDEIRKISGVIEERLAELTPEIVASAQALSDEILYVPVSAIGCSPVEREVNGTRSLYVRSGSIKPSWAEIPLLYALHRTSRGLVIGSRSRS